MRLIEDWDDEDKLAAHLGRELAQGRLGLVLGAGVSTGFGLPRWFDLLSALAVRSGEAPPQPSDDLYLAASGIRSRRYPDRTADFLTALKECLYEDFQSDLGDLNKLNLLVAIGSLIMSSRRGSVTDVITLNFDDVLERYLEYFGFVVRSISSDRHWQGLQDVAIYHPHGFLPYSPERSRSNDVVLGTLEFQQMLNASSDNFWRPCLVGIMRTRTMLQIGLSGDLHLQALMMDAYKGHPIKTGTTTRFCGVRFTRRSDLARDANSIDTFRNWGVHTFVIENFDALPTFLLRICQEAREYRALKDGPLPQDDAVDN